MSISLYDASTIDKVKWPDTLEGRRAKDYLYPLIKEGVAPYLCNVSTKMYLVVYNDLFLPLTLNEKEYENSYVASNYYALKFYEEAFSKKHPLLNKLQKPLWMLGGAILKLFKINKTIFLNNWLIPGSLVPKISSEELRVVVHFLAQKFAGYTIIFRNVDTRMKKDLLHALQKNAFHLFKTREVYFYDPQDNAPQSVNMKKRARNDFKILDKLQLEIVRSDGILEADYPRLLELYEMLYVDKYTKYSPRYSVKFVKNIHQKNMVHFVALKKEGIIVGYFGYFAHHHMMINCLFGYITDAPYSHDLYKLLTRLVLEEAKEKNLVLNDGSGGDDAKAMRGLRPFDEYMGLYNSHLSMPRRMLWDLAAFFYRKRIPTF